MGGKAAVNEMERPKITKEMILEAATQIAANLDGDAETIAENYRHPMDGYELARELDRNAYWELTMGDVEKLDNMSSIVDRLHNAAEKKWFAGNNIQPPFPIGTAIQQGIIDGIYEHAVARYRVKEYGCTKAGRFRLVKFEDAVIRNLELLSAAVGQAGGTAEGEDEGRTMSTQQTDDGQMFVLAMANRVCQHLPEGWELRLCMERGAAWVTLYNPEGDCIETPDAADKSMEQQVTDALRVAQRCIECNA